MTDSYVVLDTETTGMTEEDVAIEIGAVWGTRSYASHLVSPGEVPISFGAMATHHITPEMVAPARDLESILSFMQLDEENCPEYVVFHNAQYDLQYLPDWMSERRVICTWRCSLHLYPEAESHSNGSLWYELGLYREMPDAAGNTPHRALFDALMTHDILTEMRLEVMKNDSLDDSLGQLWKLSSQPAVLRKVSFGKHRGELWARVPVDYLQWCLRQDFDDDVKHTCRYWMEVDHR